MLTPGIIMATLAVTLAAASFALGASLLLAREARRREIEVRIAHAVLGRAEAMRPYVGVLGLLRRLGEAARRRGRLYSETEIVHLQAMITAAGHNPRQVLPLLLGAKIATMILVPVLVLIGSSFTPLPPHDRLIAAAIGLVLGMMGPDWILRAVRARHTAALARGTPDALDLMVVCCEAGLALESALDRVAREIGPANPAMSSALVTLADDLKILPDRREAFRNFGTRSGVESLQRMATILSQALQFGTPLAQALRAVADELRRDRANQLEERAVKLPAKLIIPMVLFIMPSLYIVLLGPSFMRLFSALKQFGRATGH